VDNARWTRPKVGRETDDGDMEGNLRLRLAALAAIAMAATVTGCGSRSQTGTGLLTEFEYLGCEGDWNEETYAPEVARSESAEPISFLVRNADTCGYDTADKPEAELDGDTLELRYTLSSSGGYVAACYCEYRARFVVSALPEGIRKVSVNGDDARIKGTLHR
jgi:hypothetical protein